MTKPVTVIATIVAKNGKEEDLREMLAGLLGPTHAETGCLRYTLHRDTKKRGMFYFVEAWSSQADLDRHLASAHIKAIGLRQDEVIQSTEIAVVENVVGGNPKKSDLWAVFPMEMYSEERLAEFAKEDQLSKTELKRTQKILHAKDR